MLGRAADSGYGRTVKGIDTSVVSQTSARVTAGCRAAVGLA